MKKKNNLLVKRVLVVGSWAKEQITIENLSSNPEIEIYSYMDIRNPGIISQVKGFMVGSFCDLSMGITSSPLLLFRIITDREGISWCLRELSEPKANLTR